MKINKSLFIFIIIVFFVGLTIYLLPAQSLEMNDLSNADDFYISDITLNTGRVIGVISIFLLGLTIFIGGSSRLLDKIFGLDRVLRFHKIFALVSFCILFFHVFLITISSIIEGTSIIEFYASYIGELIFLAGVISFDLFFVLVITTLFSKHLNFSLWLTIHRLSAAAFAIALYHCYNFGVLSGPAGEIPSLNFLIYLGIAFALSGVIIRIVFLFLKKKKYSTIVEIKKETYNTNSVIVQKPEGFTYKSGQFCFISFYKRRMHNPHPFTISSSPDEQYLIFTIKASGKFTKRIGGLKKGDKIKIDGPYGLFTFKKKKSIFIAGGVGITPFRSILGDKLNFIKGNNVKLIYLNKTKKDIIFNEWLDNLRESKKFLPLDIIYILTSEKNKEYEFENIESNFLSKYIDINNDYNYYVCGPSSMMKKTFNILRKNKIKNSRIYYEKFFL